MFINLNAERVKRANEKLAREGGKRTAIRLSPEAVQAAEILLAQPKAPPSLTKLIETLLIKAAKRLQG